MWTAPAWLKNFDYYLSCRIPWILYHLSRGESISFLRRRLSSLKGRRRCSSSFFNSPFLFYLYGQRDHTHGLVAFFARFLGRNSWDAKWRRRRREILWKVRSRCKDEKLWLRQGGNIKNFFCSSPLVLMIWVMTPAAQVNFFFTPVRLEKCFISLFFAWVLLSRT